MEQLPSREMQTALLITDLLSRAQVLIETANETTVEILHTQMMQIGRYSCDRTEINIAKRFINDILIHMED